jgi:uncharacterized protein (TIGR00297 family)
VSLHVAETIGFACAIASVSYAMEWLTAGGACAQFILGALLFGLGGLQWTIPILVFFLLASGISRIGGARKLDASRFSSKGGKRDAMQVIANGGVSGILVIAWAFDHSEPLYGAYLAAVAAASADTWGTELGVLSRRRPVLITTLKPVSPGASGGISFAGTCAALAGALIVSMSGGPWLGKENLWMALFAVVFCGMTGTILDSLLGATLQGQFLCTRCGVFTENPRHCAGEAGLASRGLSWIDNDAVNLLSTLAAAIAGGIVFRTV